MAGGYRVVNPTHRTKAIRAAGGLVSIKPNGSFLFPEKPDWDDQLVAKYEAAGLVLDAPEEKPAPEKKVAEKKVEK